MKNTRKAIAAAILSGCLLIPAVSVFGGLSDTPSDERFRYDDGGKRDPFVPLLTGKSQREGLMAVRKETDINLEGIIWDPDGTSFVVINGEVLRKGQEAYLVRIEEISEYSARISVNGMTYVYALDQMQNKEADK